MELGIPVKTTALYVYFTHTLSLIFIIIINKFASMHVHLDAHLYLFYWNFFRKGGVPQGYKGATFHRYVVV